MAATEQEEKEEEEEVFDDPELISNLQSCHVSRGRLHDRQELNDNIKT